MTSAVPSPPASNAPASRSGGAGPATPSKAQRLWRRTVVGGSLALAVAALLAASALPVGPVLVGLAGLALTLGCAWEAGRMGLLGHPRMTYAVGAAALAPYAVLYGVYAPEATLRVPDWGGLGRYLGSLVLASLAGLLVLLVGALPTLVGGRARKAQPPLTLVLWSLWILLPLAGLVPLRLFTGATGLVAVVLLSKVGDVVGYYVGSLIGRTHPFPSISPGKTTAGCVGSFVAGTLAGLACQQLGLFPEARLGLASGLLAGALLNLAAQAGDLLESVAKRRCGVKDSSELFGPSGGFLDIVDSLLLSVPMALVAFPWLFELPYLAEGLRALGGN